MDADRAARLIRYLEGAKKRAELRVIGAGHRVASAMGRDADSEAAAMQIAQSGMETAKAELVAASIALAIARELVAEVVR